MNLLPVSALRLATLTLSPPIVNAGDSATLTVGLNGVARQGGFTVVLRSSTSAAQVNPLISIPEGKAFADTPVTTSSLTATQEAIITAQGGGVTLTVPLEIDPANTVELVGLYDIAGLDSGRQECHRHGNVERQRAGGGVQRSDLQRQRPRAATGACKRAIRQEFGGFRDWNGGCGERPDSYVDGRRRAATL